MNNTLYDVDFTRSLPAPLRNDKKMLALGKAIAGELGENIRLARLAVIYPRIDELDEGLLDILARDLHVDWYDDSHPIAVKRQVIKDSVKVHRRLGTKYAVETALCNVFANSKVEEWFEYGGRPYTFRAVLNVSETGITADLQRESIRQMFFYKNLRSHLDGLYYEATFKGNIFIAGYSTSAYEVTVPPYIINNYQSHGNMYTGGKSELHNEIAVAPRIVTNYQSHGIIHTAGNAELHKEIAVPPKITKQYTQSGTVQVAGYSNGEIEIEIQPKEG